MPEHSDIGTRMKTYYEQIPKIRLMRRCPVICRIDGKSFHSFTKGFQRPFDNIFIESMQKTAKYLCENVQGAVLSYQQSDEISLLIIDYQKLESQAFFDYEVQKICSITASMATMKFNEIFGLLVSYPNFIEPDDMNDEELWKYQNSLKKSIDTAMFDARCFNIPKEEVTNYFYWRQIDATRNSIQMVGQANFSHKELQGKSCNDIQDMLHEQKGINWNDYPTHLKRGSCCIKGENGWVIDCEIPQFVGERREYIEKLVNIE